jgi:hypothetical protein
MTASTPIAISLRSRSTRHAFAAFAPHFLV